MVAVVMAGDGDGGQASFAQRFREVEHNVHGGQFGLHAATRHLI